MVGYCNFIVGSISIVSNISIVRRGEEQNREEGEMAQIKLRGGRNRWEK